MFTVEQIKAAHGKVKSGADFPAYIQDLKKIGVARYETFVSDGHTDYYGIKNYKTSSAGMYSPLDVAEISNSEQFESDLKSHQQGHTNYQTFCNDCAKSGIEKWQVNLEEMKCTYFNKKGKRILEEQIN